MDFENYQYEAVETKREVMCWPHQIFSIAFGRCVGAITNFAADLSNVTDEVMRLEIEEDFTSRANQFAISAASITGIIFITFYAGTALFNYTAIRQTIRIRQLYFYRVVNQDISWHDRISTGDFASRSTDDLQKIEEGINDKAAMVLYQVACIVVGTTQCFIIGWKLSLVSLSMLPISLVAMACIGKLSTKLAKDEADAYGEAGKVANEALSHIKTVVAFNGKKEESKRYDEILQSVAKNNIKKCFFVALSNGVTIFCLYASMAVLVWYGVHLIMDEREGFQDYNVEKIATIYNSIITVTVCVGSLTPYLEIFNSAKGAAEKIFSVIKSRPFINTSYETGIKIDKMKGSIIFKDVRFCYPARNQVEVLKNFNLKVQPGETIALVGSSGCGKSTILQLILRFYDITHGKIFIDGIEIRNVNLTSLRKQIGMVSQEPLLFDGTIAENIKLGNLDATQSEVEEAAEKSNCHFFILAFPDGYATMIGERGAQLSGGQKQKIALARALVRKPAILLLDEATSALDSNSETVVQATLDKVRGHCTTVIVAHRLSTVRKADRIIVLDGGKVAEEGSHDDLMSSKGVYYNLVVTQLSKSENDENFNGTESETVPNNETSTIEDNLIKIEKVSKRMNLNFSSVGKILKDHLSPKWCVTVGLISSIFTSFGLAICSFLLGASLSVMSRKDSEYVVSRVHIYALCLLIVGVMMLIGRFLQVFLIGLSTEQLTMSLRSSMYKTMIHQEIGWFDLSENGVGSLGARLAAEPSSVQNAINLISIAMLSIIMTPLLFCIGFYLSWKLMLGFCSFFPIMIFMIYLEQKLLVDENQKNMEVLEKSTKLAVEAISNVRTIASLAVENVFHNSYILRLKAHKDVTIRNIHVKGIVCGFSKGSLTISYIMTLYYGAYLIKSMETDATTVIALTEIFLISMWSLISSVVFVPNCARGFVACNQIYDLLNRKQANRKFEKNQEKEKLIEGDIEYKSVSFSYPMRPDTTILEDLDLSVLKGKTVALVGPSGCGKSTIIQLLERFYDTKSGDITFGKNEITGVEVETLRFRLGFVMQEPNLFSRTIEENIAYGNTRRVVPREEIIEVAQKANIHTFITSLPLGYETVLGERGTQLSGGQKQRIAIARALLRNPEVLILDEATSALDSENEKIVQDALNMAKEQRTCIVIAHRLKTIVDSDVIVVINGGQVVDKGTHQELMNSKGLYWILYNAQHQS